MSDKTVYVVVPESRDLETTFIRYHIDRLPATVVPIFGYPPRAAGQGTPRGARLTAAFDRAGRVLRREPDDEEITRAYLRLFKSGNAVVLAEYGPAGVHVMEACKRADVPLVVHFHGYDATVRSVLSKYDNYRGLFENASAVVSVSRAMSTQLRALGAPETKIVNNPYGVDCKAFKPANVIASSPVVVAVGGFVDKKAPHLTILAFSIAHAQNKAARLRMIGDGHLRGACEDLVLALHLSDAVTFVGNAPHEVVRAEMSGARCFVQHSVTASDGNCEGTPNAVLEAGASGLPTVSTRHAGIIDAVVEGETGLLVNERDVTGMADHLLRLSLEPALAAQMGQRARARVEAHYAMDARIQRLWNVLDAVMEGRPVSTVDDL